MLSDAPDRRRHDKEHYKLASNLVRNLPIDNSGNSLHSGGSRKQRKKVTDNSTGSMNLRVRDENRRRRRRKQRQIKKCHDGNDQACQKLKAMEEEDLKRVNGDLLRSLDRRSSRNGGNNNLTREEKRKLKRERRRLRKMEKRQKRLLRKKQRREQRRKNRKQSRKNMKKNESSRNKRSTHNLQCPSKYVDNCGWPHCNRSCPKLKNPETGASRFLKCKLIFNISLHNVTPKDDKYLFIFCYIAGREIDLLGLLKSFGLEIGSVAKAIGVDINTLNNMNKDVLRELLTSKSSSSSH